MNYDGDPATDPPERQSCDTCGIPTKGPIEWDGNGDADWFVVIDKADDDLRRYFCSLACVAAWAEAAWLTT